MARKRKIPTRKHHGIRDPLKQLENKEKKLKGVTNNPPEKDYEQKNSFKFTEFKRLLDNAKAGRKFKKQRRGVEDAPKSDTINKGDVRRVSRNIKQHRNESDKDYLRRVKSMTRQSLQEAEYEVKYGVEVLRNHKTGEITVRKRPKNEIDELLKAKRKSKRSKSDSQAPIDPRTVKELVNQAIKEENQEERWDEEREYKRDEIKFGEVVHGPPVLSTLPRKALKSETVPRPGRKHNLLLRSILTDGLKETAVSVRSDLKDRKTKVTSKTDEKIKTDLKAKRKDLPMAVRSMLETEQRKFIELYRNLKKSKN